MKFSSSTSKKHKTFCSEPMGEKRVSELAGIGPVFAERLTSNHGIDKAYIVLGHFLVMHRNEAAFKKWLKSACGSNAKQNKDCFRCLCEWCASFM